MIKHFWREKNANYYLDKNEVIIPTNEELFEELVKKFVEKLQMINVIFDKEKRNEYLSKKNKSIPEETPEIAIQQKIGTRVIVDFLQLTKDMSELKNYNLNFSYEKKDIGKDDIYKSIEIAINNLQYKTEDSLMKIHKNIGYLIHLLSLSYDKIEEERQRVEEKEGSFLKGKIVII